MSRVLSLPITICVATIGRPYALQRLLRSIRNLYAQLPVIIADQNEPNEVMAAIYRKHAAQVIYPGLNCGVAMARNAAVAAAKTEYVLILDDDFIFEPGTRLPDALSILQEDNSIDILGGMVRDVDDVSDLARWRARRWEKVLTYNPQWRLLTSAQFDFCMTEVRRAANGLPYFICDSVLNFALMRRSIFEKGARWDPQFKCNGEHEDFYLNLKTHTRIGIGYCPSFLVLHHNPFHGSYFARRNQALGWRLFREKWNITQMLEVLKADHWQFNSPEGAGPKVIEGLNLADRTTHSALLPADSVHVFAGADDPTLPYGPLSRFEPGRLTDLRGSVLRIFAPEECQELCRGELATLIILIHAPPRCDVGCVGSKGHLGIGYKVMKLESRQIVCVRDRASDLVQDLKGITFQIVNINIDWEAEDGDEFAVVVDLWNERDGWMNIGCEIKVSICANVARRLVSQAELLASLPDSVRDPVRRLAAATGQNTGASQSQPM